MPFLDTTSWLRRIQALTPAPQRVPTGCILCAVSASLISSVPASFTATATLPAVFASAAAVQQGARIAGIPWPDPFAKVPGLLDFDDDEPDVDFDDHINKAMFPWHPEIDEPWRELAMSEAETSTSSPGTGWIPNPTANATVHLGVELDKQIPLRHGPLAVDDDMRTPKAISFVFNGLWANITWGDFNPYVYLFAAFLHRSLVQGTGENLRMAFVLQVSAPGAANDMPINRALWNALCVKVSRIVSMYGGSLNFVDPSTAAAFDLTDAAVITTSERDGGKTVAALLRTPSWRLTAGQAAPVVMRLVQEEDWLPSLAGTFQKSPLEIGWAIQDGEQSKEEWTWPKGKTDVSVAPGVLFSHPRAGVAPLFAAAPELAMPYLACNAFGPFSMPASFLSPLPSDLMERINQWRSEDAIIVGVVSSFGGADFMIEPLKHAAWQFQKEENELKKQIAAGVQVDQKVKKYRFVAVGFGQIEEPADLIWTPGEGMDVEFALLAPLVDVWVNQMGAMTAFLAMLHGKPQVRFADSGSGAVDKYHIHAALVSRGASPTRQFERPRWFQTNRDAGKRLRNLIEISMHPRFRMAAENLGKTTQRYSGDANQFSLATTYTVGYVLSLAHHRFFGSFSDWIRHQQRSEAGMTTKPITSWWSTIEYARKTANCTDPGR